MSISRRQFIKDSFILTSAGVLVPSVLWHSLPASAKIFVDPIAQSRYFQGINQHTPNTGFDVTKATIILPDAPLEVHRYAARELMEHIQKSCGAALPIQSESTFAGNAPRIYLGPVQSLQKDGIAAVPPPMQTVDIPAAQIKVLSPATSRQAKEVSSTLWLADLPKDSTADSVDFVIDLGTSRNMEAMSITNRADTVTNYSIGTIRIEVGNADDGKNFDQVIAEGAPQPASNDANVTRSLLLTTPVKARYLRIKVLSSMWGKMGTTANTRTIQWQSFGYISPALVDTASTTLPHLEHFPSNAFLMESRENALFLAGRDEAGNPLRDSVNAGTLFAVYEWLQRQLGVRWIWPGELGTHIPIVPKVLSGSWKVKKQPPLLHARMRQTIGKPSLIPATGGFTPKQRSHIVQDEVVWYRRSRFARGISLEYGHGYEDYWERFHETHPEYFNLLPDGTRRSDPFYWGGAGRLISMSVSDPKLHQQVVDDWATKRTENLPWINGWENDTNGKCICPQCLAWDARDPALGEEWNHRVENAKTAFDKKDPDWYQQLGSVSDRYAKWCLALQEKGKTIDPTATVIGGAYANYAAAPLQTKLNKNIVIGIVPTYGWPVDKSTFDSFKSQWLGWHRSGASLYLRPNYTLYGHEQPIFTARQWAADFKLAAQNGMIATDYDSLTSMWATQGVNIYTLARLHWQPDADVDVLLDEYAALFGPAANPIRKYLAHWERRTQEAALQWKDARKKNEETGAQLFSSWADSFMNAAHLFPNDAYKEAHDILNEAALAAGNDERCKRRVDFMRAGLKDAELVAATSRAYNQYKIDKNENALITAVNALDVHRAAMTEKYPNALNVDLAAWMENRHWNRDLYQAFAQVHILEKLPLEWQLRWDPENAGIRDAWFERSGDDTQWQSVRVDSAYNNQPAGKAWSAAHAGASYLGKVWYRIRFEIDSKWRGKVLSLLFGAVDEAATVYLNGVKIAEHTFVNPNDWQTPFTVPLGVAARFGESNELMVLVENNIGAGGVWKPVWLVETK